MAVVGLSGAAAILPRAVVSFTTGHASPELSMFVVMGLYDRPGHVPALRRVVGWRLVRSLADLPGAVNGRID